MSLIVKSGVGKLRVFEMTQTVAAAVAHRLVIECRSFYSEPRPFDKSTIYVDEEHAARVKELIAWAQS